MSIKLTSGVTLFTCIWTALAAGGTGTAIPHEKTVPASVVSISGRSILLNDAPYRIRGICYHPVPKGETDRSFNVLSKDLKLMKQAGINTIRLYSPVDDPAVLDQIHAAGLKVIIGFGYNQNGYYDVLSGSFIDYIKKYKHHQAILMWELGNEYNYHPEWFEGDIQNWYTALNKAAALIHQSDPAHPVATAHGELPDRSTLTACPNIDVWGLNIYRWDHPEDLFAAWAAISPKPMYLSEAGADSYMTTTAHGYPKGENEKAQADATRKILESILSHPDICSGVALFSFTDGWWKAGHPERQDQGGSAPNSGGVPYDGAANEEYWGIVDIDRTPKAAFDVVRQLYTRPEEKSGDPVNE